MKKTWLQNSDNHLEGQLVGVGAATKKKKKKKNSSIYGKKDQIQETRQEDGHCYSNQVSGTITFEVFPYQKLEILWPWCPKQLCAKVKNHA